VTDYASGEISSLLRRCVTAVSAVTKFENVLVSRTAETAVARGMELFNGLQMISCFESSSI